MIKTRINRHDMEYFLYAMAKAFCKDAFVYAPDTAEHNMAEDDEAPNEDLVDCSIEGQKLVVNIFKGNVLPKNFKAEYDMAGADIDIKDAIRKGIYDAFAEYFGRGLPWGNLTGIRPIKLYLKKMLEKSEGDSISEEVVATAVSDMSRIYGVSGAKGRLAADIAVKEHNIIGSLSSDGYSIYIGIPFCPSRCLYCSFTSNPISQYRNRIDVYLNALKAEMLAAVDYMKGKCPDTIYIGGGTPSALEAAELDRLLGDICSIIPIEHLKEFTVEAGRPDSITEEKLQAIRKYPVTRISINPQTFSDDTLKLIGRRHSALDVVNAFNMARAAGFDNINMDIILGLPEESMEDIRNTMTEVIRLAPESLTVHSLAIKRASILKQVMEEKGYKADLDFGKAMDYVLEEAGLIGLKPYYLYRQKDMGGNLENTGLAKEGREGIYNVLMMEEVQTIIACGAGTVTKRVYGDGRIERCDNVKDVALYISKIEEMIDRKRQLFKD